MLKSSMLAELSNISIATQIIIRTSWKNILMLSCSVIAVQNSIWSMIMSGQIRYDSNLELLHDWIHHDYKSYQQCYSSSHLYHHCTLQESERAYRDYWSLSKSSSTNEKHVQRSRVNFIHMANERLSNRSRDKFSKLLRQWEAGQQITWQLLQTATPMRRCALEITNEKLQSWRMFSVVFSQTVSK